VEVSSPEVYGIVSEKCARKNMAFEKHRGGNQPPLGSSRVKHSETFVIGHIMQFSNSLREVSLNTL